MRHKSTENTQNPEQEKQLSIYEQLIALEKTPPNPQDQLQLSLSSQEVGMLKQRGVSLQAQPIDMRRGQIDANLYTVTRVDLQKADVAFINRVSRDNQKPIIEGASTFFHQQNSNSSKLSKIRTGNMK